MRQNCVSDEKSLGNKGALLYSPNGSMCALRGRQPGQPNVRAVLRHFVPNKGPHPLRRLRAYPSGLCSGNRLLAQTISAAKPENPYLNIFDNAKTDVSGKDEKRLIASLKKLSSYEDLEDVLDMDAVLRYFVVHNFVVNGDSYTGSMIHNYYLYEQDGKLSMLPWDYNLAFGGFQGNDAERAVNDPIDDVLSDRPMQAWMFSSEEYTELYHEYYEEFLQSADIDGLIDEAYNLIAPYVEKDPTKFCTYDEFETGVQTLKTLCSLRAQSVTGQLDGSIPSTSEAQKENSESLVDASAITISDMGSIGNTMGGKGGFGGRQNDDADKSDAADTEGFTPLQRPDSSADAGTDFEADTQGGPPQSPPDSQNGTSPGQTDGQGSSRTSGTQTVLLAACALVLALGLGFAVFYKRR